MRSMYTLSASSAKDGETLLFNAATGCVAAVNDEVMAELDQPDGAFHDDLKAYGFVVDDDADELEEQRRLFSEAVVDRSKLWLALAPTYACNCRCPYCYEQDKETAKSRMSGQVIQAVYDLVEKRYQEDGFNSLSVEWYGGDPQLCLDIVQEVSGYLMDWCAEHGVGYESMMLSNSTLIGAEQAALIAQAGVNSVMITIDGPEEMHNFRRPAAGVDNPFQRIVEAVRFLQQEGVGVVAVMNTDKVNAKIYPELHRQLKEELGVELTTAKLNDYAHSFGTRCFKCPEFDLLTHEEYAFASFEMQRDAGLLAKQQIKGLLSPAPAFCLGQRENYFVIDAYGDVYKCDGWMGDKTRSIGNLLEETAEIPVTISFDPFEREECRACPFLPLCMGNCSWEQERCGWPCHPLRHTLGDYLRLYRSYFPADGEPFQLLA